MARHFKGAMMTLGDKEAAMIWNAFRHGKTDLSGYAKRFKVSEQDCCDAMRRYEEWKTQSEKWQGKNPS
jgi:hypothetical protein